MMKYSISMVKLRKVSWVYFFPTFSSSLSN